MAINRLGNSDERNSRQSARHSLRVALNGIRKHYFNKFPALNKAGKRIMICRRRRFLCPACNDPMNSVVHFCEHWIRRHAEFDKDCNDYECACGMKFAGFPKTNWQQSSHRCFIKFVRHVRSVKDLDVHFTLGSIYRLGGKYA